MAYLLQAPFNYFVDVNGLPLSGGKVYTYNAGTTTPKATYTDSTGTVAAANPIILDSTGIASIWISGTYNIQVYNSSGVLQPHLSSDNITSTTATGDMTKSIYDPANIQEQIVGLTAPQTLTNKTIILSQINSGQLAGFRNRIINGGMQIDQRNSGGLQTFTTGAALAYCVDRWYGYCTGANVTGQQINGSSYSKNRYQFNGAASVTAIGFGQRIEAANCYDLNGRNCKLAVDLSNSLLTNVTWTAYYANSVDSFGTLASPTRTQIATGTFTVTNSINRYYADISIPVGATTGIEIVFTVGAQTSGTWIIGDVDLVAGTASELWHEQRPYGLELALCQRYSYVYKSDSTSAFIAGGQCTSGTAFLINIGLPVQPRVSFTGVSISNVAHFNVANASASGVGILTLIFNSASKLYAALSGTVAAGLVAGDTTQLLSVSTSGKIEFTGAEL